MANDRPIHWDRAKNPATALAITVATALGAGLSPIAPGTAGSLIAIPLCWYSMGWPVEIRVAMWALLAVIGIWSAKVMDQTMNTGDHQSIVIDEVVGMGITSWTVSQSANPAIAMIAAFAIFRLFDVTKPPPVRQIDRWSKKKASQSRSGGAGAWWGGFGVMADDVLAAFQGLVVMILLQKSGMF